jgi:peptidoglycan biosynthesis protein MviN/MurJ (putative lipid II flippase)
VFRYILPLVVVVLLMLAVLLPSMRDAKAGGWWRRVRSDLDLLIRSVLALLLLAAAMRWVLMPLLGWDK